MNNLLQLLGVNIRIFQAQAPAEQSKVLILALGLIVSPIVNAIVFGVFVGLLTQSNLAGLAVGGFFGLMMFFFDRSFLEPVKNNALYIRFAVSLALGLVFSLGIKYWFFQESLVQEYVKEVQVYNATLNQDRVVAFEEDLLREEQHIQAQIARLSSDRHREQRTAKVEQLNILQKNNRHLIEQRKVEVENLKEVVNETPMGTFLYMVQALVGKRGNGYEWFINLVILLLGFSLEAWAFIGAIILRGGDYMAEMEIIKIEREDERVRRITIAQKMRNKTQEMDEAIMNDSKSVAEIRRDIVLVALKREYAKITQKQEQSASDRQRLQEILTELEQLEEDDEISSETPSEALAQSLKGLGLRNNAPSTNDEIPPEFLYSE